MKGVWLSVVVALWTSCYLVDASRILAFVPFPAKSHQRVIQPLLKELARRGHQVVCYTPHPPDNVPPNYTAVRIPDFMPELKKLIHADDNDTSSQQQHRMKSTFSKLQMLAFKGMGILFSEWAVKVPEVQALFNSKEKFDVVFLETTFFQEIFITLGHKFNAPVIEFLPAGNLLWSYWLQGNPTDVSYTPECLLPYTDHMTLPQRVFNTFLFGASRLVWYNYFMPKYQQTMDKYIRYDGWETRPPMMDMISNTSLVLVNTHFSVNYPFPLAPHFKEVGGLNIEPTKPLPKDLQTFMDEATEGVIYFTLGSHIDVSSVLGDELKQIFSKVFGELKQKVLWKWEKEFPGLPSNVRISKWFPQQDILAHKNTKLFITHGGLLSTTEAVYQGVPTVGIAITADQFKNVEHMNHHKYGVPLELDDITYDTLKQAINKVLDNPEYAENAKKRSQMFRDKPETALETAVYWTEYVIRHKGAHHLRPAIATMPWYQQAMLDVYLVMALIVLIPTYISYRIAKCFVNCLCGKKPKSTTNKKKKKE